MHMLPRAKVTAADAIPEGRSSASRDPDAGYCCLRSRSLACGGCCSAAGRSLLVQDQVGLELGEVAQGQREPELVLLHVATDVLLRCRPVARRVKRDGAVPGLQLEDGVGLAVLPAGLQQGRVVVVPRLLRLQVLEDNAALAAVIHVHPVPALGLENDSVICHCRIL